MAHPHSNLDSETSRDDDDPNDPDDGSDDDSDNPFQDSDAIPSASDPALQTMSSTMRPPPPVPASRHKPSRSATAHSGVAPVAHPTRPRRSLSEDSSSPDLRLARAANARTKSHGAASAPRPKEKPSAHADSIDQLDITVPGAAAAGMFHHDGPFDAVSPSRNRTAKPHRAPMYAFDNPNGAPHNVPVLDKRLSPLAQATISAMASSDGPYASASLMPPTSPIRTGEMPPQSMSRGTMMGGKLGPSRKMTLTEAWGKAEPEPFEEFSAGTFVAGHGSARSSLDDSGYEAYQRKQDRPSPSRRGESLDMTRRNKIPPPQPIILPGARTGPAPSAPLGRGQIAPGDNEAMAYGSDYTPPPKMQRTRSLMQRIRNMRENPNVPVPKAATPNHDVAAGYYSEGPYTPREGGWTPGPRQYPVAEEEEPQMRQAHSGNGQPRPRHVTRGPSRHAQRPIPESPEEPFVFVDTETTVAASREKALPAPPGEALPSLTDDDGGYFDRGVGRKQSLYKKMKGAVVGGGHGHGARTGAK